MWFYAAWAFVVITLTWGRKGVRKMMNSEQYREHIERTFNAFCKIVLYHAALGAYKKSGGKCYFCGTTSVTATQKSVRCAALVEAQSSADEKLPCVSCEKKWRR